MGLTDKHVGLKIKYKGLENPNLISKFTLTSWKQGQLIKGAMSGRIVWMHVLPHKDISSVDNEGFQTAEIFFDGFAA